MPTSDRRRLEHISRYLLRPAIATERLELLDDGIYRYELKRPWSDGTQAFLFEPLELMEKLAALVPIPRANLVRYHGVLAPASTWRAAVVPSPVVSQNSAGLDVHRSVRFGSRPLCSLFDRDSTISRLLMIDGLRPRSSFGTPRGALRRITHAQLCGDYSNTLSNPERSQRGWLSRVSFGSTCSANARTLSCSRVKVETRMAHGAV